MSGLLRHLVRRVLEPESSVPPRRRGRFLRPLPPYPEPAPGPGLAPERLGRPAEVFREAREDHPPPVRKLAGKAPSPEPPATPAARAGAAEPPEKKAGNEDSRDPYSPSPASPVPIGAAAAPIENGVAVEDALRDSTATRPPGDRLRPARAERRAAPVDALSEAAAPAPAARAPAAPERSTGSLGEGEARLVAARAPAEAARARPTAAAPPAVRDTPVPVPPRKPVAEPLSREPAELQPKPAAARRRMAPVDRPKPPSPTASAGPAVPGLPAPPFSTPRPILPEPRPGAGAAAEAAGLLPRRADGPRPAAIGRPGRAPAPPDVHITIGRVEIRAVAAAPPARKPAPTATPPVESLADYLARRDGARR